MLIHRVEVDCGGTEQSSHRRVRPLTTIDAPTNFTPGALRPTGNPLDMALLEPDVFFTVVTEDGVRYTRNGSFQLNANGELVTSQGHQILGTRGPIRINGTKIDIDATGFVYVDDVVVDRLLITTFAAPEMLQREASQYFQAEPAAGPLEAALFTVAQGQLSNQRQCCQELVK